MNFDIKKVLIFNHKKGTIEFKPKKPNDYLIFPIPENLRHIGKVTRYYIMKHYFGINQYKFFGITFTTIDEDCTIGNQSLKKSTIYYTNKKTDELAIMKTDTIGGGFIYSFGLLGLYCFRKFVFTGLALVFLLKVTSK